MYKNVSQLIDQAKHMPLHRVILENEMQLSEMTEKEVYDRLEKHYDTMVSAATRAIMQPLEMTGNFIKGQSF